MSLQTVSINNPKEDQDRGKFENTFTAVQPVGFHTAVQQSKCGQNELQMSPLIQPADQHILMQPFEQDQPPASATPPVENMQGENPVNQAAAPTQVCDQTLPANELQQREQILTDFTRDYRVAPNIRNILISSLCDFSLNQLTQMQQAGLRFWSHGTLPSLYTSENIQINHQSGGAASYVQAVRIIFLRTRVNSGYLTHEMAHAWDHIRNLPARNRVRLEDQNRQRRLQLIQNPGRFFTATNRRHQLNTGGPASSSRFTFQQMYDNYRNRVSRRELAFSRAAREGYSLRSVQEFYAEGYAVFHGTSEYEQAKIYKYAREFYIFLNGEATSENMPVPNLTNIQAEARRLPAPR